MTEVAPSDLANAIMGRLYDVLTNGDATVPKSPENFFTMCAPGIPMKIEDFDFLTQGLTGVVKSSDVQQLVVPGTPTTGAASSSNTAGGDGSTSSAGKVLTPEVMNQLRASDAGRMYMQAEQLARLCDFVPDVSSLTNNQLATLNIANNEGTLSDRYEMVLKFSQVMSQDLDADTQAKIAKFRGLLQTTNTHTDLVTGEKTQVVGPSALIQAYNDKMAAYETVALQYNNARIAALAANDPAAVQNFALNAGILRNRVEAAKLDWVTNGYKTDYEEIAAYIDQVQQRDLKLLKAEYEDDFAKATLTGISSGSNFLYTALIPGNFATSSGWSGFSFSSGDFATYRKSTFDRSGWSQSGSGGYLGIVGVKESSSHSQSTNTYNGTMDLESFNLSFEIAQIPICRPWFKEAYICSKAWRFDSTNPDIKKNPYVSDGGKPPTGLIPAYPTAAIFIRNLRLGIHKQSSAGQWIDQQTQSSAGGSGAATFGGFFLGGSATHYSSSGYSQSQYNYSWDDKGLVVPGLQLAGFKCHVFSSQCPNPDPTIKTWV